MNAPAAVIFGCSSTELTPAEAAFFKNVDPWGFILFARNLENPDQIRALTDALRQCVGRNAPILIDQEGGRVQRLRAPDWTEWLPPLTHVTGLPADIGRETIELRYRIIAAELLDLGIDVNCAPMLDIATDQSHDIITNRCFGRDAGSVIAMGRAAADGLLSGGVLPIIKHIPGHGRANLDSHYDLPHLDTDLQTLESSDFQPFAALADLPMAMTAHIVYRDIDPDNCATQSPAVIRAIRETIGFNGLIMTDDLSMKALAGSFSDRCDASFSAGCDVVLHCNGVMDEMAAIAGATPTLSGRASERAEAALARRITPAPLDKDESLARFDKLMQFASHG